MRLLVSEPDIRKRYRAEGLRPTAVPEGPHATRKTFMIDPVPPHPPLSEVSIRENWAAPAFVVDGITMAGLPQGSLDTLEFECAMAIGTRSLVHPA